MNDLDSGLKEAIGSRGLAMSLEEARRLAGYVGRMPTALEFHLFDTMWSEHCSYKSSKAQLRKLPVSARQVVIGPGEDAGVVRFCRGPGGDIDLVVAHESHNHPSQILPVEGAATGIGGIVRDVYCMGARVIGSLDLLRFGDPQGRHGERSRAIARGVVEGIWKYGNALGVPNLGGDTVFDPGFDDNCLVNVVALGIVPHDRVVHSFVPPEAHDEQYVLILAGKPTDDTGFGGATFASADLEGEEMEAVQVADPFLKRVLSEANLVVLDYLWESRIPFGFKDLGAGGIACVTSELAAHGNLGIVVDLDSVPVSIQGLPPEVIACAETQERYGLAVPERAAERILEIYNGEFELSRLFPGGGATVIGRFTSETTYRVMCRGEEVASAPVSCITEGVEYDRPAKQAAVEVSEPAERPSDPPADIAGMLLSIAGCSRSHVWSYYDSEVQGATHLRPGEGDACVVVPVPGCPAGLAVAGDGNPWYGKLDPRLGGAHAVGEAVRNVVAAGAVPVAATDCLNYGNPEVPEVFWQFSMGVEGIAEACRSLGLDGDDGDPLPIVSGNVSFYNQSATGRSIPPSPVVAVFGRLDDYGNARDMVLRRPGNRVLLVGPRRDELGGSLYYRERLGFHGGLVPRFDGELEAAMARFVLGAIDAGLVESAHDISEGGIAMAAAEMSLATAESTVLGIELDCGADPVFLYSETPGYLLEVGEEALTRFGDGLPGFVSVAGRVVEGLVLSGRGWTLDLSTVKDRHRDLLASVVWREEGI
jgi:phosphoribosylformylglycinamidine synthase II